MGVEVELKLTGGDELDAALRALPEAVRGDILKAALEDAGEVVRAAAAENIHSRTGQTAKALNVKVQVSERKAEGAVAIGGGRRSYVLRWLEFGTKDSKKPIRGGESDRKLARKAAKSLRRIGDKAAALALRRGVRDGTVKMRRALKLPGGIFRASAKHRGMKSQSPLTRALAERGPDAVAAFSAKLWDGIEAFTARVNRLRT